MAPILFSCNGTIAPVPVEIAGGGVEVFQGGALFVLATAGHLRRVPAARCPSEVEVDVVFHLCTGVYPLVSAPHSYALWLRSSLSEYLALDPVGGIPQFICLVRLSASVIGIALLIAFAFWSGIVGHP